MNNSFISQMLRSYRQHKNLTQPQLAAKLGKFQPTISQLENGKFAQFDKMTDLAQRLNIKIRIEFRDSNGSSFLTIETNE